MGYETWEKIELSLGKSNAFHNHIGYAFIHSPSNPTPFLSLAHSYHTKSFQSLRLKAQSSTQYSSSIIFFLALWTKLWNLWRPAIIILIFTHTIDMEINCILLYFIHHIDSKFLRKFVQEKVSLLWLIH